jgi:hypothetical protein
LLLCFWVSGFKSQPKRGPPKKGKRVSSDGIKSGME